MLWVAVNSLLLNMVDMVLYTGVSNARSLTPTSHRFQGVTGS